ASLPRRPLAPVTGGPSGPPRPRPRAALATPPHTLFQQPARTPVPAPLQGVLVLDLSRVLAGPFCTMLLGNLGARIVKVELPGEGDVTRGWGPPHDPTSGLST